MKLDFLYYKHLLDVAFIKFFDECNDFFSKDISGTYVFSSDISRNQLKEYFKKSIVAELKSLNTSWTLEKPRCLVIVGSCFPKDNILLELKDSNKYFPVKLSNFIESNPTTKWILKERGIHLDFPEFNSILVELFNDFFKENSSTNKSGFLKNILFITHRHLDCYAIFKILKIAYGKSSVCNLYKKTELEKKNLPLIAINELVSKYVNNKSKMNSSSKFKEYANEVKQYASKWIDNLFLDA